MFPRALDHAVEHFKVELAFLGFDLVPGNARKDRVEFCLGNDPRPYAVHVINPGGGAVTQLSGQRQERLAIHDQLGGRALFPQVRQVRGRGGRDRSALALACKQSEMAHENGTRTSSELHVGFLRVQHKLPSAGPCFFRRPPLEIARAGSRRIAAINQASTGVFSASFSP